MTKQQQSQMKEVPAFNIPERQTTWVSDCLPARYVLTFLTFMAMCLMFAHRVCFNVAIVAMVNQSAVEDHDDPEDKYEECPNIFDNGNVTYNYRGGSYIWTPSIQGLMLGSYFYGYVFTQIIGGRVAELVGPKWLLGSATLVSTVLTALTPVLSEFGVIVMIALRLILGLVHGFNYPSVYTIFGKWAPIQERSTLLSICVIGTHFGTVLSMPLTGFLCEFGFAGGWPSAFYVFGIAGAIWFVLWLFLVFDTPDQHPRISKDEWCYIRKNLSSSSVYQKKQPIPWKKVLTSPPIWAVSVAKFTGAWSFICLQSKLPAYLEDVLHFPIQQNGLVNALPFTALCVSLVTSGYISDVLRMKQVFATTTLRKLFETFALFGPALCMAAVPQVGCDSTKVVILLTSAMALFGLSGGGDVSVIVDMAPQFAGKIFGLSNAFASIPGIISPYVAGIFLEENHGDITQWGYVFYTSSGLYLFGALVFFIFGSAEPQEWAKEDINSNDLTFKSNEEKSTKEKQSCTEKNVYIIEIEEERL